MILCDLHAAAITEKIGTAVADVSHDDVIAMDASRDQGRPHSTKFRTAVRHMPHSTVCAGD